MAWQVDNKVLRNLQEQVEKNKQDIAKHYEIDRVLSDWGIKVLGVVNTPSDIPEGIYEYGDAYGVRTGSGIVYYVWTRANINVGQDEDYWLDIGALSIVGPTGPQGLQGPQGIQGVRGSLWVSSTTSPTSQVGNNGDQWLDTATGDVYQKGTSTWTRTGNIKGPQGVQGPVGPQGAQGIQGPTGSQGPKGDTGSSFKIGGLLNSIDNLPVPTEANRSIGYAVARQDNTYDLYVVVGTDNLQWVNMGRVEGVEGPQGPVGPQGPAGADIQIVSITGIPSTATSGTLTQEQVQTLLAHPGNYIQFFNENFYPQDVEIEKGYIVYSHVGQIDSETKIKNINLTIATGGWVLTETSLVSAPITIVNELPEANEENFEKGKIYTTGELLQYISKVALSEPNLAQVGNSEGGSPNSATNIGNDIYYHTSSKQLYKLNTQTFTFTQLPFTSQNGDYAQIISVGTDIYLFGGDYLVNTGNKKICKYNTLTNEYTFLKNLPDAVEQMGIAKVGTDIYLFGGHRSGNYLMSTIYKYDTNTDTLYTVNATLPAQMQGICAVAYGTDIYLFGGSPNTSTTSTSSLKKTILKFNTITNSLTTLDITLSTGIAFTTGQVIGDSIYLFGGLSNGTKVQKFNPTTNEITTLSSVLPTSKGVNVCSAVIGDNVYIMGGGNYSIAKAEFGYTYQYKTISTQ